MECAHLDQVQITQLPGSTAGCEDCLAAGDPWLHLRICLSCGKVGCCDDSPNRHASAHAAESGHPLIRSIEPREDWSWCFVDQIGLEIPEVRGETEIQTDFCLGSHGDEFGFHLGSRGDEFGLRLTP